MLLVVLLVSAYTCTLAGEEAGHNALHFWVDVLEPSPPCMMQMPAVVMLSSWRRGGQGNSFKELVLSVSHLRQNEACYSAHSCPVITLNQWAFVIHRVCVAEMMLSTFKTPCLIDVVYLPLTLTTRRIPKRSAHFPPYFVLMMQHTCLASTLELLVVLGRLTHSR